MDTYSKRGVILAIPCDVYCHNATFFFLVEATMPLNKQVFENASPALLGYIMVEVGIWASLV